MNKTEKIVLETIIENIVDSHYTKWESGNLDDWATYAKQMKAAGIAANKLISNILKISYDEEEQLDDKKLLTLN